MKSRIGIVLATVAILAVPLVALQVRCEEARFQVSVIVLPSPAIDALLGQVRLPDGARTVAVSRNSRQATLEQPPASASGHFRETMPRDGWRLADETVSACGSTEQQWVRNDQRLLIRMQAPIGGFSATRISLQAVSG
jgi:hypothetical protein